MSNVYWPRRPDLCNRDDRFCVKYEERQWILRKDGETVGWLNVVGDYTLVMESVLAQAGFVWERVGDNA